MWATTNFGPGPCRCTATYCNCGGSRAGQYTITFDASTNWPDQPEPDDPEPDDPPKKNDPVPPWLASSPFGGKMRKTQRSPAFSSPMGLRAHRRQAR